MITNRLGRILTVCYLLLAASAVAYELSIRIFDRGNSEFAGMLSVALTLPTSLVLITIVKTAFGINVGDSDASFLVVCLLFSVAVEGSGAQAVVRQGAAGDAQSARPNTWSARSSTGRTLMGTWTAVPDPASGTVTGTWTLADAQGRTVTRGGWSAAKSPAGWTGAWRAAVSGGKAGYSGTWSAGVDLKADAPFADLFEKAVQTVVSGNWRAGRQSGAWSIRVFK